MKRKVIKTGNSLAVTIPAEFVKKLEIKLGDEVGFILEEEKSRMTVLFLRKPRQIPLFQVKKKRKKTKK